ncbi:helix-turn-helix domain-containing protein [Streptomyces sp. NBC_00285]|uniref:helix-turn-helix domain-containing protein n=1 Tax=Streptomyces sp. NBC_00285 TaxID=2975700 RepID=UPI002E2975BB|nr:helix-turn-helix transcriptional regulator [Streptomyces sp. NBC_00285]
MIRVGSRTGVLSAPQAYALGHRLREVREEQGLTRGQAALTADFHLAWITQMEGGEIHDLETLRAYAHALGTRIRGTRAARVRRP